MIPLTSTYVRSLASQLTKNEVLIQYSTWVWGGTVLLLELFPTSSTPYATPISDSIPSNSYQLVHTPLSLAWEVPQYEGTVLHQDFVQYVVTYVMLVIISSQYLRLICSVAARRDRRNSAAPSQRSPLHQICAVRCTVLRLSSKVVRV